MNKYQLTKKWLKEQAIKIKETKNNLKETQRENLPYIDFHLEYCEEHVEHDKWATRLYNLEHDKKNAKRKFRYKHIACSLFRGKTLEQIEQPKHGNEPNMKTINSYLDIFIKERKEEEAEYEQAIRFGA